MASPTAPIKTPTQSLTDDRRPTLRGWSHAIAFFASIPAGVALIAYADGTLARTAVSIYVATLLLGFGTSAAYHRLARTPDARRVMQRLDHAMIHILIAGTYVPVSLLGLPSRWGVPLLIVVSTGAVVGFGLKIAAFDRVPSWVGHALYPALGWAALVVLPVLVDHVETRTWVLLLGGGVAYTVGFPVLLMRRPDLWPSVFGYHEVWHLFTIAAALMHFGAVASLAR